LDGFIIEAKILSGLAGHPVRLSTPAGLERQGFFWLQAANKAKYMQFAWM